MTDPLSWLVFPSMTAATAKAISASPPMGMRNEMNGRNDSDI